jgi:hypothetical protein
MSSLKIDEVIRRLPENGYNVSKTAREVGYTEQGSRSGTLYETLRKRIAKHYNPEAIKDKILKAEQTFLKAEDYSNYARMLELQAKILGLTKEVHSAQGVTINIEETLAKLKEPKVIDAIASSTTT